MQFQELTNKFEEINFKLDKLSTRLSKVQADNQLRFQQLENKTVNLQKIDNNLTLSVNTTEETLLPGSFNLKTWARYHTKI